MSDQHTDAGHAPPVKTSPRNAAIIVAVVASVLGGGAGAYFIGPAVARRATAPVAVDTARSVDQPIHLMENMVLNPAGTSGTRFLMATVAIEAGTALDADKMNKRDAELRDVVLGIIGARTIDQLATLAEREPIKKEILDSVKAMFGPKSAHTVYFPQFVIQ